MDGQAELCYLVWALPVLSVLVDFVVLEWVTSVRGWRVRLRGRDRTEELVAKFEKALATARGSEWRLHVCGSLPSRGRKGAASLPDFATPSKVRPTTAGLGAK
jgi:hypothetical protein